MSTSLNGRDKSLIFSSYFGFRSSLIGICDLNEYCQNLHYLMIVRELLFFCEFTFFISALDSAKNSISKCTRLIDAADCFGTNNAIKNMLKAKRIDANGLIEC